jgi:hypothetical protein
LTARFNRKRFAIQEIDGELRRAGGAGRLSRLWSASALKNSWG